MIGRLRISAALRGTVAILAALVFSGCGERSPTESELQAGGLRVGEVARAVWAPAPFQGGIYRREIGPGGGTLYFGVGSLTFPPGALASRTVISAVVDGNTVGADFSPEGLRFPASARPHLVFATTRSVGGQAQIVYVDADHSILELMETAADPLTGGPATKLSHFSPYILAQN